eukprot:660610_1
MYNNVTGSMRDGDLVPPRGCVLADAMGLGKTLQVLIVVHLFLRDTAQANQIGRVILVCPATVVAHILAENGFLKQKIDEYCASRGSDTTPVVSPQVLTSSLDSDQRGEAVRSW